MRLDRQSIEYLTFERTSQIYQCWQMLVKRFNSYRVGAAEARREAEALWNGLYWPGNIEALNTLVRRAVTALRRGHHPQLEYAIVLK